MMQASQTDVIEVTANKFIQKGDDGTGDRLFIIIPKQAAWLGGMVDIVEKENEGWKLTETQIAELEKEFMATFEILSVMLSLSNR